MRINYQEEKREFSFKSNPNPFSSTTNLPHTTVYFLLLAKKKNYQEIKLSNPIESSAINLDKQESIYRKKSSIFYSSYSSEDERRKKENFEKKLEDLSDEKYFLKIKEEKSPSRTFFNFPQPAPTHLSDEYIELEEFKHDQNLAMVYFF